MAVSAHAMIAAPRSRSASAIRSRGSELSELPALGRLGLSRPVPLPARDGVQHHVDVPPANHGAAAEQPHLVKTGTPQYRARRRVFWDAAGLDFAQLTDGKGF